MKNILLIINSLSAGGAEKVLIDILNEFDYSKFNVTLLLLKKEGRYINRLPHQVKLLYVHSQTLICRISNKILRTINAYEFITTIKIRKTIINNYDTIVSFTHGDSLKYHTKILNKSTNNITWVHCDMWNRNKDQIIDSKLEEVYYNNMNKIIFVSNDAQKQFNKLYNNKTKATQKVIYNLIPVDRIIKMSEAVKIKKNNKFTICTVGRLYEEKAYDRLIRVAAMLKQSHYDFEIWIIAEGILLNELKDLSESLEVNNNIIFYGFQDNPYPFIKNTDVFISTSKTEALSLVVCEALCLSKPVIATKTTGPIELLSGDFGLLTDHDDKSIYNAIELLITKPDLIRYYQKRGFERSKIFDLESTILSIYEII